MASYLVVQISDVHLTVDGVLAPGVRPRDNLVDALRYLEKSRSRPDVLVLSGDLANTGDPACYDDLRALLAEVPGGAEIVCVPGNHDDRAAFRRHLLGDGDGDAPVNVTRWRAGLRVVALDSSVPGEDFGVLDPETLSYLAAELATPAQHSTVVVLHHPPLSSPIEPMAAIALRNAADLRDVLAGSDVRFVLAGHNHHPSAGALGGVPVWVSPATAYRADVSSTAVFRAVPGSAISRIDLTDHGDAATVVPIGPADGP